MSIKGCGDRYISARSTPPEHIDFTCGESDLFFEVHLSKNSNVDILFRPKFDIWPSHPCLLTKSVAHIFRLQVVSPPCCFPSLHSFFVFVFSGHFFAQTKHQTFVPALIPLPHQRWWLAFARRTTGGSCRSGSRKKL